MLKKILAMALAMLTTLLGCASALAEFEVDNQIPDAPIVTENETVSVTAAYSAETDQTLYTIMLKDAAKLPDGSALTADDLLFSWYVYLDPGYTGGAETAKLLLPGLENYRLQASAETLANARAIMAEIEKAGADHVWTESDGWSAELQQTYWSLKSAYDEACRNEYPNCVRAIVDFCREMLLADGVGAFGMSAEQIAADEDLCVAYAMLTWGYAVWEDDAILTSTRTRTAWQLGSGICPTVDDFVHELKAVYGDDLAACWAVETTGTYSPALPDWKAGFLKAAAAENPTAVLSVEGVRVIDEKTVEVTLPGIDMQSEGALLGVPVLSLKHFGDSALWNPAEGRYGHPFSDVSAIEAALAEDGGKHSIVLLETVSDDIFHF